MYFVESRYQKIFLSRVMKYIYFVTRKHWFLRAQFNIIEHYTRPREFWLMETAGIWWMVSNWRVLCVTEGNVWHWLAESVDRHECVAWRACHARLACCLTAAAHWPPLKEPTQGQRWHPAAECCHRKAANNWRQRQLVVDAECLTMMLTDDILSSLSLSSMYVKRAIKRLWWW